MTKVCIFCEKWGSGGIETFLLNAIQFIDRSRFDLHLLTATLESKAYLPRLKELDMTLTVLPESPLSSHMRFRSFYRAIKPAGYDVIHFNLYEGLSLGYVAEAKRAGVPVRIVHSHNSDLRKSALRPIKLALHHAAKYLLGKSATERVACSRTAANFLFTNTVVDSDDWMFVPNGIRLEKFRFDPDGRTRMRKELGVGDKVAIGCIGRLCFQKNQKFLLYVFARLNRVRPDSVLYLVGEGEDRKHLEQCAKTLGIADAVVFYGVTDRVPELLWAFDVLAVPSVYEGLGIVAIEAQAAGLPVICSDRLPEEACVTDLAKVLPTDSAEVWSEELLRQAIAQRKDTGEALLHAGYSIQRVAEILQKLWSERLHNEKEEE